MTKETILEDLDSYITRYKNLNRDYDIQDSNLYSLQNYQINSKTLLMLEDYKNLIFKHKKTSDLKSYVKTISIELLHKYLNSLKMCGLYINSGNEIIFEQKVKLQVYNNLFSIFHKYLPKKYKNSITLLEI